MIRRARRRQAQEYRYYVHVIDESGLDKPLTVLRVRGEGDAVSEEEIGPGVVWRPTRYRLEQANRTQGYSALPVDADTASRVAARWAYSYRRIVERSSERTVAYVRFWIVPSTGTVRMEESTCRSGVWESTRRLTRVETGLDDYAVETVEAATVDDHLRDLPRPEYRYFAVVQQGGTQFGLHDPAEVLRVRSGQESGARERLGPDWEPYEPIDGARGLRDDVLLEIDETAVAAFRSRRSAGGERPAHQYTYYALLPPDAASVEEAQTVLRQWRTGGHVHEDVMRGGPQWVPADHHGRETRAGDPRAVEISPETVARLEAAWRYTYYEILAADSDQTMAVVRHYDAHGGREEAVVGWPVWYPSQWLQQIAEGRVAHRAREVDAAAAERHLRRVAADRPAFRYLAFLDTGESIDSAGQMARMHCDENGRPWKEETPRSDGTWAETFSLLDIDHGKGKWWIEPVEVPQWLFERYRAKRQGDARAG